MRRRIGYVISPWTSDPPEGGVHKLRQITIEARNRRQASGIARWYIEEDAGTPDSSIVINWADDTEEGGNTP